MYLRISEDRSGDQLGVQRQRQDCEKLCADRGWTPVDYLDNDTSATSGKPRLHYERMLDDIRAGHIQAVVCWHLHRLHRSPIELETFMALADEKRVALATVTGDVDLSTDDGQFMARIMGAVARKEVDRKRARQLSATRQLAERGVPNWSRAFGYLGDTRQPDPRTAPLVREAYAAVLAGASLGDVCRLFNEAGALTERWVRPRDADGNLIRDAQPRVQCRPWTPTVVSKFLRKPRNAGLRTYGLRYGPVTRDSVVGKGNWPALVDEETFWAAQSVLEAPGRAPGRKAVRRHLLTGVAQCGKCGHHLAGSYRTDGRIVYVCKACHGVSILAENVEPLLYSVVSGRLAMPDAVNLLKAEIHDATMAESLRTQANTLLAELDNIGIERADGLLTGRQAKIASDRINGKLAAIERKQQDQERLRVFDGIPLGTAEVANAIKRLSPDRFRAVLHVLATVTVAPVGKSGRVFNPERVQVNWL